MSYALLTMLVILAPALGSECGDATVRFYSRLFLFGVIAVYGTAAVAVFDAFWPAKERAAGRMPPSSGKLDTLNEA